MENFILNKNEVEKLVKRLEFDASYDKVGQVYYRMKTWLQNQTNKKEE